MSNDSTLNERVAEEIRVMLARRNITASELARQAGMTQRSVSRRITGEKAIDMDDLERIAAALGVEVAALLPAPARRENIGGSSPLPEMVNSSVGRMDDPRPVHAHRGTAGRFRTRRPVWTHAGVTG